MERGDDKRSWCSAGSLAEKADVEFLRVARTVGAAVRYVETGESPRPPAGDSTETPVEDRVENPEQAEVEVGTRTQESLDDDAIEALVAENRAVWDYVTELREQMEARAEEVDELRKENDSLVAARQRLKADHEALRADHEALKADHEQLQSTPGKLETRDPSGEELRKELEDSKERELQVQELADAWAAEVERLQQLVISLEADGNLARAPFEGADGEQADVVRKLSLLSREARDRDTETDIQAARGFEDTEAPSAIPSEEIEPPQVTPTPERVASAPFGPPKNAEVPADREATQGETEVIPLVVPPRGPDLEALLANAPARDSVELLRLRNAVQQLLNGASLARQNAQKTLVAMGPTAEPFFVAATNGATAAVAKLALDGLEQLESAQVEPCIDELLSSPDFHVRLVALRAAQRVDDDQARTFLSRGSRDASTEVRRRTVSYLSWRATSWALAELRALCDDPDAAVKRAALEALSARRPDPRPAQVEPEKPKRKSKTDTSITAGPEARRPQARSKKPATKKPATKKRVTRKPSGTKKD